MSRRTDWNCKQINSGDGTGVFIVLSYSDKKGKFKGYSIASGTVQQSIVIDADTATQHPRFKEGEEAQYVLAAPKLTQDDSLYVLPSYMIFSTFEEAHRVWLAAGKDVSVPVWNIDRPYEMTPRAPAIRYNS
jgi:hypothetical protein